MSILIFALYIAVNIAEFLEDSLQVDIAYKYLLIFYYLYIEVEIS